MRTEYICKIPTIEEMNDKWDYEINNHDEGKNNWIIWKKNALKNMGNGNTIAYYGILEGKIICEATAVLDEKIVQNSEGLVDEHTVYLKAFRTIPEYQGHGYFSILFKYMIEDLNKRGFKKVTLGVEPTEIKNKKIYAHYGFNNFLKCAKEKYPDGELIDVEYYEKTL